MAFSIDAKETKFSRQPLLNLERHTDLLNTQSDNYYDLNMFRLI